jgi:hypothetical protein
MSFRASEGSQWSDRGAAVRKRMAFLVASGSRYTVSDTGPATAYLGASGATRVTIDPAATEHANGAALLKISTRYRIF